MEEIVKIMDSLSKILWPVILIIIIIFFHPAVKAIIESAKSRKFTLKIGGQELTMEQANEQQRVLFDDIQSQLSELKSKIDITNKQSIGIKEKLLKDECINPSILWIDDHPKSKSYFIEQLDERGIKVDIALSTDEGLAQFMTGKYVCIISDMRRKENGKDIPEAGIILLKKIRNIDAKIPYYIFCSPINVRLIGLKAKESGVTGISSSPSDLFYMLRLDQLIKQKYRKDIL